MSENDDPPIKQPPTEKPQPTDRGKPDAGKRAILEDTKSPPKDPPKTGEPTTKSENQSKD